MKKRGERAVEANTDKDTPVQVEFKVTKTAKSFNLRDALGKLLTTMIEVDASVKIQSKGGDEVWNDPNELPVGESMQDHFKVRQDTPPYEAPRITIYFTVKSTWKVNDIKYDPHMITYLKNFNIFMRPDRYSTSKVRSPGYFVKIAPRLVWKQDVVQELKDKVGKTNFDLTSTIIEDYYRDNDIPKGTLPLPLPDFHVHVTTRKFGLASAKVLTVTCADGDALYLKKILSNMAEQGQVERGLFVPTGLHLVAGPATVVNLLRNQNSYMSKLTVVALEGIKREAMKRGLKDAIMKANKTIISIEQTSATDEKGKWFVILPKTSEDLFQDYLDTTLKTLVTQDPVGALLEGYDEPRRAGAQRSANIVGSYAAMLRRNTLPTNSHKQNQYDKPTSRPKKRTNTNLLTHQTNQPITQMETNARSYAAKLQSQMNGAHKQSAWIPQSPPSTQTASEAFPTPLPTLQETPQEVEERMNNLENKLDQKLSEKI